MDYVKEAARNPPRCLECGDKINYGRTDKKFCSEECKNRHHNHQLRSSRNAKRRVLSALEKNYSILEEILKSGKDSLPLSDAMLMGFNPGYATSFRKLRCHQSYGCFDINYIMTPNRLSSISKIQNLSLNLQAGPEEGRKQNI